MEVAARQRRGDDIIGRSARLIFPGNIRRSAVHPANGIVGRVRVEVRMVEQVERVQSELQIHFFGDLPRLLDGEVVVKVIGAMAEALRLIADVANVMANYSERRGVVHMVAVRTRVAAGSSDVRTPVGTRGPGGTRVAGAV